MRLHFDPNQQFQLEAINSLVGVFEGQSLNQGNFSFTRVFAERQIMHSSDSRNEE